VIIGGVVSRTIMVCTALAALPQASVAVQVRTILFVPPQPGVTASLKETLTCPQLSWAEATRVEVGVVSAGHSNAISGGAVTVGGVVSMTITELLHVAGQPLLVTFNVRVNPEPQRPPALTVTIGLFAGPEMAPLPEMDQE
jgi:hypothetical protein